MTFTYNGGTVGAIITFPLCGRISHIPLRSITSPILKHHPAKITDHWYLHKKTTISGIIVDNTSWVWIFYGSAALTFLWAGLWAIFFYDMPEDDPFITGLFFQTNNVKKNL